MNNLSVILFAEGDLSTARKRQVIVLEALRETLGNEHPRTAVSMNNLAQTLRAQGDLESALGLQTEAVEALGKVLGDHPATLKVEGDLAETQLEQRSPSGAVAPEVASTP